MIKNIIYKDLLLIGFLLLLSYLGVYYSPNIVRTIIFVTIVVFFIKTKDNAPWVVFFFFLFSAPATLFYGNNKWFFLLTSSIGIEFSFIVAIAFLIKGIKNKEKIRNRFAHERNLYIFVFLFLFLVGFVQDGLSFRSLFIIAKQVPNIFFILFIPLIIDLKKDSLRIKKLFYVLTIVLFIIQMYEVILGQSLFNEGSIMISNEDKETQRNITGIYFVFFTFIIAVSDIFSKRSHSFKLELIALISSSLILINSATRGFMIAISLILIGLLFFGHKTKVAIISLVSIILVSLILVFSSPKYVANLQGSFNRLSSVIEIVEGNKAAGGPRMTRRGPRVMKEFKKSPILGTGFSDRMQEYYDGHVADKSILLQSGIFGFTVLYLILFRILWHIFQCYLKLNQYNILKIRLISMIIGFLGIMVIHFSSEQMYMYLGRGEKFMLLAFWFLFTFYYLDEAKTYKKK